MRIRQDGWKRKGKAWICVLALGLGLLQPVTLADDERSDAKENVQTTLDASEARANAVNTTQVESNVIRLVIPGISATDPDGKAPEDISEAAPEDNPEGDAVAVLPDEPEDETDTEPVEDAETWQLAPSITGIMQTGKKKVFLSWAAEAPAEGYEIGEYADGAYTSVKTIMGETAATLSGVAAGSHQYAVRPWGTVNGETVYGEYSSRVTLQVLSDFSGSLSANASSTAWKKAPKITKIQQTGNKKIQITWNPVSPAEKYEIYEYTNGKYQRKKTVTGVTTVALSGVKNGKHTYAVRPLSTSGGKDVYGKYSAKKSITVMDAWKVSPELTAWQTKEGEVNLSWTVAAKAGQYGIYEYKSGKYTLLKTVKKKTAVTLTKVSDGDHTYVVLPEKKVSGKMRKGEYSEKVRIKVVRGWEIPVTITDIVQQEDGQTVVNWTVNGDPASRYDVYEVVDENKIYLGCSNGAMSAVVSLTPGTHLLTVRARQIQNGSTRYGQYCLEKSAFVELKTTAVVGEFTVTVVGSGKVRIDAWLGNASSLVIPATIFDGRYQVTEIGEGAFANRSGLKSVTLPEGLSRIESRAFANTGITAVNLPSSLTYVAEDAFNGSYLKSATAEQGTYAYSWARKQGLMTEYRALLIGEYTFARPYNLNWYLEKANRNVNDAKNMASMLKKVTGPAGGSYDVTRMTDVDYEGIKSAIQSTFADTMDQDVSLFFIATHGYSDGDGDLEMPFLGNVKNEDELYRYFSSDTYLLSFTTLASWLQQYVKGEVIVILESCGAGSAIYAGKAEQNSASAKTESDVYSDTAKSKEVNQKKSALNAALKGKSYNAVSFTSNAVSAFERSDPGVIRFSEGGTYSSNRTGDLRLPKFYVLAAARHHELSWGWEPTNKNKAYNFFTKWLIEGVGKKGNSPADTSGDGFITLTELFTYIKKYDKYKIETDEGTYYQHVQRYPAGSKYKLFAFP